MFSWARGYPEAEMLVCRVGTPITFPYTLIFLLQVASPVYLGISTVCNYLFTHSPPPYWWWSHFLIMVSLMSKRCSHIVVLISISLITDEIEHLFICLLAICVSTRFITCLNYLCWFFFLHTEKVHSKAFMHKKKLEREGKSSST